ncbi:isoprenylcysteine carboxylmethyltransferase family protein [Rhizobium sp. ARZ01]|uniref:methyltransferase family protein n=1 Tax=Rhizobium sp. ARZ01 TaxID=2769313 RepID=UPI0017818150|nr:isoprenylcysteine carboxylmethyltransferase family protein [Rhizobium sp. ARZ01]MBD9372493.1 isoprenylcysteine carboxylmethyltransferase family protein [Rhizobium sp. ARZ01]
MNAYRSKPFTFPWPPIIYVFAAIIALALQLRYPSEFPTPNAWLSNVIGALLFLLAAVLGVWALRTLKDGQTTALPHRCASHLVTNGPYRYTRNPIYLAHTLAMAGIGILLQNPWFLAAAIAAVIMTTLVAVRREELHLLSRFGFDFERYCRSTARWI